MVLDVMRLRRAGQRHGDHAARQPRAPAHLRPDPGEGRAGSRRFEHELNDHREAVLSFFRGLPFCVRTSAGVTLGTPVRRKPRCRPPLCAISTTMLYCRSRRLAGERGRPRRHLPAISSCTASLREPAFRYLAVRDDATHAIRTCCAAFRSASATARFRRCGRLFTQNERGLTAPAYVNACRVFRRAVGRCASGATFRRQRHMPTRGGHDIVGPFHLRVSTAHA